MSPQSCHEGTGPSFQSDPCTTWAPVRVSVKVTLEKNRLPFSEYFGAAEDSEVHLYHGRPEASVSPF